MTYTYTPLTLLPIIDNCPLLMFDGDLDVQSAQIDSIVTLINCNKTGLMQLHDYTISWNGTIVIITRSKQNVENRDQSVR